MASELKTVVSDFEVDRALYSFEQLCYYMYPYSNLVATFQANQVV